MNNISATYTPATHRLLLLSEDDYQYWAGKLNVPVWNFKKAVIEVGNAWHDLVEYFRR